MKKNKQQILSIQLLRGLAAWLVVYHHYNQVFFSWDMSKSIFGNNIGYFFAHYGKLGVDIFFVISGFIIFLSAQRNLDSKYFIFNRILRVIPPYWFFTLTMLFLSFFIPESVISDWTISSIIKSLLFIHHENPSPELDTYPYLPVGWTLILEMVFYFLCMLGIFMFKKYWYIPVIIILFLGSKTWPFDTLRFFFDSNYISEFGWGITIGLVYSKNLLIKNNKVATFFFFASIVFFTLEGANGYKIQAITLLIISLLMYKEEIFKNTFFFYFKKIGDYSYSTYLIHAAISIPICSHIFSIENYYKNDLALFSTYTILTLLLSYLSYKYIEGSFVKFLKKKLSGYKLSRAYQY